MRPPIASQGHDQAARDELGVDQSQSLRLRHRLLGEFAHSVGPSRLGVGDRRQRQGQDGVPIATDLGGDTRRLLGEVDAFVRGGRRPHRNRGDLHDLDPQRGVAEFVGHGQRLVDEGAPDRERLGVVQLAGKGDCRTAAQRRRFGRQSRQPSRSAATSVSSTSPW